METKPPTAGRIFVAIAFAFSCFGLLLFLWTTFGGSTPLAPKGFRFEVPFNEATQLSVESDVRISNVSVGKVKKITRSPEGQSVAEIEIDAKYAPIPNDTRAILRQKTLLGETYVELTPGSDEAPKLAEDGELPAAQVAESVQLDEIFRTFDARTRAAFQTWMQNAALAVRGRGADISAAIANLEPFAADANRVLRVLDTQDAAVSELVRNTGTVFDAITERRGQLQGLIKNSDTVFSTTARRNAQLADTFRILPTFLDESRETLNRTETFAADTNPLITQLRPAARRLSPVLKDVSNLAPHLQTFFQGFRKVEARADGGLGALRQMLGNNLPPILAELDTFSRQLQPILDAIGPYKREITAFLGNVTGATQASNRTPESGFAPAHYLRTISPLSPEALAAYPGRLGTNRSNPYTAPGAYDGIGSGIASFETRACGGAGLVAQLNPADAPAFPGDLFDRLQEFAFNGELTTSAIDAPPCIQQGKFNSIGEIPELTDYLHVYQRAP
jgi:phospholipid/cholesterol/gamma-HCH transport system substrate-binding protein